MALPPSLSEHPFLLVADASVIISLNATGCAEAILDALPHRVAVVDIVVNEIRGGLRRGRHDAAKLETLIETKLLHVVELGPQGLLRFESLVVGDAGETLDDGEAATLAYAEEVGGRALIDERKARRLAAERHPAIPLSCTIDLLACDCVSQVLGPADVVEAIHSALVGARMRVLNEHMEWVVELIGDQRSAGCPSLSSFIREQARTRLQRTSAEHEPT
jgi:predicted nucleic acid-binding protein